MDLEAVLRERFGHASFRTGQAPVVRALLQARDSLTILPTGGGKSLIYQLAAQLLPGLTIVVSPLLALMRDQVESLQARGLRVGVINSTQSAAADEQALRDARSGTAKLLYVTPERFDDADFMAAAGRMSVSLFVVDESHSISEWGHTFRPAYLRLGEAIERLKRPTILALTATATPWVRRDIIERLGMRDPLVLVRGTDRPNLFLDVTRVEEENQDRRILQQLFESDDQAMRGSGIIYVGTTRAAYQTARWLTGWGIAAEFYHGQRKKSDRERVQDAFMSGKVRVIAATNAFGMGVDKPDVRFVVHRDIPASLETYYQEAGRAGRDGQPARCTLIYRPGDLGRAAFLAGVGGHTRDEHHADEEEKEARRRAYDRSRLEMMRAYAELRECRRRYILNYFGEEPEWVRCGNCDVDLSHPSARSSVARGPFAPGERVAHRSLGDGVVEHVTADAVTVLFDEAGYKTLDLELVMGQDLLRHREDESHRYVQGN